MVPEQDGQRDLPAVYESPWRLLGRDLRAVLASQRLAIWELWRRNRQGSLPLPRFWPTGLAAAFWPLLLALLLALVGLVAQRLGVAGRASAPPPVVAPPTAAPVLADPVVLPPAAPGEPSPAETFAPSESPDPSGSPSAPEPGRPPGPDPQAQVPSSPPPQLPPPAPFEPPAPAPSPLLQPFAARDPEGLLAAARLRPADGQLELVLGPGWLQLPADGRQRQADRWQLLALAEGYERLVLVAADGRVLARPALVGSGMILLPVSSPLDADRP